MTPLSQLCISPLEKDHDRRGFECGFNPINNFVINNVRKDNEAFKIRAFVLHEPGSNLVLGLYCLTVTTLEPSEVDEVGEKKFERAKAVPLAYLTCIAVRSEHIGHGFGWRLMQDAIARTLAISQHVGIYGLFLEARSEELAVKYEGYGFERFEDGGLEMFVPLRTLLEAAQLSVSVQR